MLKHLTTWAIARAPGSKAQLLNILKNSLPGSSWGEQMAESTGPKSSRGQWRVEIREQFLEADSFLLPHVTWGSKLRLSGWVAQYLSLQTHLTGPNLSFYPGITVDVSSRHPLATWG